MYSLHNLQRKINNPVKTSRRAGRPGQRRLRGNFDGNGQVERHRLLQSPPLHVREARGHDQHRGRPRRNNQLPAARAMLFQVK